MKLNIAYVPVGVGTFHMECAARIFEESKSLLRQVTETLENTVLWIPETILLTVDAVSSFLQDRHPDLMILQNVTFANGAYASVAARLTQGDILLWTVKEPVSDGSRLRLNALTGAFSAGNALRGMGRENFFWLLADPAEKKAQEEIGAVLRAAYVKKKLRETRLAAIGLPPQGFGFGQAGERELLKTFGVTLESIEARELMECARQISDQEADKALNTLSTGLKRLEDLPAQNVRDFARLYLAYTDYVEKHHIDAVASRCWPDFFTAFKTPVCAVLALLNSHGTMASCETDAYGVLSMYIGKELSGKSVFFGDPVSLNEKENTLTFWHCGMAATDLAREDTGAVMGVHPNRKIGPVCDFGCEQAEHVTIFRVGKDPEGKFRFFAAAGKALDRPKQYQGVSLVVQPETNVIELTENAIKAGWEPHFAVVYGDISREIEILAKMLEISYQTVS